jgi:hypothetical protein
MARCETAPTSLAQIDAAAGGAAAGSSSAAQQQQLQQQQLQLSGTGVGGGRSVASHSGRRRTRRRGPGVLIERRADLGVNSHVSCSCTTYSCVLLLLLLASCNTLREHVDRVQLLCSVLCAERLFSLCVLCKQGSLSLLHSAS